MDTVTIPQVLRLGLTEDSHLAGVIKTDPMSDRFTPNNCIKDLCVIPSPGADQQTTPGHN